MSTHIKPAAPDKIPVDDFPIEDGVPMPERTKTGKYPFKQMNVGQSFFVAETVTASKNVRASVSNFQKANKGWSFTTSTVDKPLKGLRVWLAEKPSEEGKTS